MIFKALKNKSKRWALYFENWASYGTFCDATWGENLYQARFSNLKISVIFWDLGPIFCKWAQILDRSNFYIATMGPTHLLHWFLSWGWFSPPPSDPQNLDPLTGRVNKLSILCWETFPTISQSSFFSFCLFLTPFYFIMNWRHFLIVLLSWYHCPIYVNNWVIDSIPLPSISSANVIKYPIYYYYVSIYSITGDFMIS